MIVGRVVQLGNSAAISMTKKDKEENRLRFGQRVEITVWTAVREREKKRALNRLFGSAPNAKPLEDYDED